MKLDNNRKQMEIEKDMDGNDKKNDHHNMIMQNKIVKRK